MADAHIPLTLVDWLDDLCVRFLVNLPQSELSSVPRLCFQVEEAQWYYEDFARPAVQASGAPPLPHLSLRQFCLLMFQHCPLLSGFTDAQHIAAYEDFLAYKVRVPVRGAILLDQNMEKLILVRGWKKGASWSFPRGKINKDERDLDCAIREVYEETGFDLSASGLIPENEDDIKHIDVTMREQHIRLFVFRGVPEDTHFETKTRKEISKIAWYWIKDLPGFKKQSKQQQQPNEVDTVHASKFYMVAPFLGQLKKWIGQQRKNDIIEAQRIASVMHAPSQMDTGLADGNETYPLTVAQQEDELRRVLNSGSSPALQNPVKSDAHSGDLLAMLRSSAQTAHGPTHPQKPLDRMDTFPARPETLQPQHSRQVLHGHPQAPPQFPYSPQRAAYEQQRQASYSQQVMPDVVPDQHYYPSHVQSGMVPRQHQQQHQQQQRQQQHHQPQSFHQQQQMPFNSQFPQQDGRPFNGFSLASMTSPPFVNHPSPNTFMAQGVQGAIASEPAIPRASQLPAPNPNAHTKKLLDAFKGGNSRPLSAANPSARAPSTSVGTHQAALLDLLKKPAAASQSPAQSTAVSAPVESPSSAPTDATEQPRRPSKAQQRKPTLNEITRTLPLNLKAKATPPPDLPSARKESTSEGVGSTRQFTPSPNEAFKETVVTASSTAPLNNPHSPIRILQRPSSRQQSTSPGIGLAANSSSPSVQAPASKQNGAQPSAFTILTRPGPSRGTVPPAPSSALKHEAPTPTFQPQVLKRPQSSVSDVQTTQANAAETKDTLLALFGKGPSTATPTPAQVVEPPPTSLDSKTTLLDLFKTNSRPTSSTPTAAAAVPPPAPKIQPTLSSSGKPSPPVSTTTTSSASNKQTSKLLDLFNKSSTPPANTGPSPSTPISPFVLGTPMSTQPPQISTSIANALATASNGARAGGNDGRSGTLHGASGTPSQNKDFLLGYLNGVVKGAGQ